MRDWKLRCGVCLVVMTTVVGWSSGPSEGRTPDPRISSQLKDVPFQALQVIVRRGASGTVETRGMVARNSEGSTYVQLVDGKSKEPAEVLIFDVPGRRELVLNMKTRSYRVLAAPALAGRPAPTDFVADQLRAGMAERDSSVRRVRDGVEFTWKGLGVRRVGGLETIGSREVRRPLAGAGESSDGPVEVDERWISVDLGIAVLENRHDPLRAEDTEVSLTEVLRAEPDPRLFTVPEGFVLADDRSRTP